MIPIYLFLVSRASSIFGLQIIACTFLFRIVNLDLGPYGLGQLGLSGTLSTLIFALPLGFLVDHMKQKHAVLVSHFLLLFFSVLLALMDPWQFHSILATTALIAVFRNFRSISQFTVFGELIAPVSKKETWINFSTLSWQISAFIAPLLAGFLGDGQKSLFIASGFFSISFICQPFIVFSSGLQSKTRLSSNLKTAPHKSSAGFSEMLRFLATNFKLQSSLLLDFIVVIFAGVSSLLPFLHANHQSYIEIGWMRSALPAGVIFGTLIGLQQKTSRSWAKKLFVATLGYGICHFLLAESYSIILSCFLLFIAGIFDALSLSIRECLLQIETPKALKGRIYALNSFLVNGSDELSEWESGQVASWVGIRSTIRIGGTLAVIGSGIFGGLVLLRGRKKNIEMALGPASIMPE